MSEPLNMLIAEDHPLIVMGLKSLLLQLNPQLQITTTESCHGILSALRNKAFEFGIFDLNLEDGNSIRTIEQCLIQFPDFPIMVYTSFEEDVYAKRLLKIGVRGFLSKSAPEDELKIVLSSFLRHEFYVSPAVMPFIFKGAVRNVREITNPFEKLSLQELTVIEFLQKGLGIKEIAEKMGLLPNTVATYKKRAYQKLNIETLVQLMNLYETGFNSSTSNGLN